MKTNKEIKKEITAELKEAGYNSRKVSVSVKDAGWSTKVDITIKDPTVNAHEIEAIVNKRESIDRDERTGEILAGGNTYVFVSYKYGLFDQLASDYLAEAENAMHHMAEAHQSVEPIRDNLRLIKGTPCTVETVKEVNGIRMRDDERIVGNAQELAKYIAMYTLAGTIA
ncbi:hypothetical protein AAK706_01540 [Erysipelotrichaceae bacterium 66-17]